MNELFNDLQVIKAKKSDEDLDIVTTTKSLGPVQAHRLRVQGRNPPQDQGRRRAGGGEEEYNADPPSTDHCEGIFPAQHEQGNAPKRFVQGDLGQEH